MTVFRRIPKTGVLTSPGLSLEVFITRGKQKDVIVFFNGTDKKAAKVLAAGNAVRIMAPSYSATLRDL